MKLTDEQIIKALERCSLHKECCYCNAVEECGSKKVLTNSALDLINRQKAEIESSQMAFDAMKRLAKEGKVKAIKEFVEKLKEQLKKECSPIPYSFLAELVDNLVKEMVGDADV